MLTDKSLDQIFGALANPTRRAVIARLSEGPATVGELAAPFEMSRPAISQHLDVLERAGLVHRVPEGRVNLCRFDGAPLQEAIGWMARYRAYWEGRLDALTSYFEREEGG